MSTFGRKLSMDNQTLFKKGLSGVRTFGRKYGGTARTINNYAQPLLSLGEVIAPEFAPEIAGLKYGLNKAVGLFPDDTGVRKRQNPRLER